jgi:hypothetical protein
MDKDNLCETNDNVDDMVYLPISLTFAKLNNKKKEV